jgi:hypothetical protein
LVLAAVLASALAPVLAVASGDTVKARQIYTEGSKRVASHFNGATCPNVKAP